MDSSQVTQITEKTHFSLAHSFHKHLLKQEVTHKLVEIKVTLLDVILGQLQVDYW